jgi:hypothetical protein
MMMPWVKKMSIILALILIGQGIVLRAGEIDENRYKLVTAQEIIINPDSFKSKRIQLETKMLKIAINIPTYIVNEYSKKKYCYIIINPRTLPLIAKIKDFQDKLKIIKTGTKIKVFGKVKEFRLGNINKNRKRWRKQRWPQYYILIEEIRSIEKENKKPKGK